jgi:SPP1 family predicted phage head-tail adaptor
MIGKLRHRISLLEAVREDDDGGGAAITWQVKAYLWARIIGLSSAAETAALQDDGLRRLRATIRYREDITHQHRIEVDGRRYEITSIRMADEKLTYQELQLREVKS